MSRTLTTKERRFQAVIDGRLALLAYPPRWTYGEFVEWVDVMAGFIAEKSDAYPLAMLIFANGQGLSAHERKLMAEKLPAPKDAPPMRQALLTNSSLSRGVLTAVSWVINKPDYQMRAFTTQDVAKALTWLQATAQFEPAAALGVLRVIVEGTGNDASLLG